MLVGGLRGVPTRSMSRSAENGPAHWLPTGEPGRHHCGAGRPPNLPDHQHLILDLLHVPASVGNGTKSLKRGAKSSTRRAKRQLPCLCSVGTPDRFVDGMIDEVFGASSSSSFSADEGKQDEGFIG